MKTTLTTMMAGAATVAVMAAGTALTAAPADAAFPFNVSAEVSNPNGFLPGSTVINFDDPLPTGVNRTGGAIVNSPTSGVTAKPNPTAGGSWLTVGPSGPTAGPATLTFGNLLNYYGLYWGSVDTSDETWNVIEFLRDDVVIGSFNGSQLTPPILNSGSQIEGGSAFVNFTAIGPEGYFNAVRLTASQFAFESDNHAFRVVPTPAAVLPGLIGMGTAVFRKKKQDDGADVAAEPAEANA